VQFSKSLVDSSDWKISSAAFNSVRCALSSVSHTARRGQVINVDVIAVDACLR
jgi:hypothetical protein